MLVLHGQLEINIRFSILCINFQNAPRVKLYSFSFVCFFILYCFSEYKQNRRRYQKSCYVPKQKKKGFFKKFKFN